MLTPDLERALEHKPRDEDNQKDAHESLNALMLDVAESLNELLPIDNRGKAIVMRYVEDLSIRAHHELDMLD